jgi:transposase InsO family protein
VLPAANLVGVRQEAGLNRKAGPPVHDDDLVDRKFTATAPNVVSLTDITEHNTAEGKLYLCAIKDVHSGRIVGYSIDSRMKASLAVAALRNAITRRDPVGTVVHSDRGSQFRSNAFVRTIKNNGLVGSMGRVGACGDNAAMESFFALLQKNVLDRQRWPTREELRLAIITWIERTDLPPPTPAAPPRTPHTDRVRDTQPRHYRGLTTPPNESTEVGAVPFPQRHLMAVSANNVPGHHT